MSRVKIDLPEKFFASFTIPVRISDINYGNHVGNDAMVSIIHEARMQFLKPYGYTELDIEGTGLIMADLSIKFKKEAFYKDVIEVKVAFDDISKMSFSIIYSLNILRENNSVEIARAKTGMVCYDYKNKKVTSLPDKFLEILKS
jgi:YbgC/YbaW family acyl-CoA thioester hydrolase